MLSSGNHCETKSCGVFCLFEISEKLGQAGYTLLPAFIGIRFTGVFSVLTLAGMLLSLIFYYSGWIRYFIKDRDFNLLFTPMAGIPIPMAISPKIYFAFYAVGVKSWIMGAVFLLLALGHLPIIYKTYKNLQYKSDKNNQ